MEPNASDRTCYHESIASQTETLVEHHAAAFDLSDFGFLGRIDAGVLKVTDSDEMEEYFDLREALEAEANTGNRVLWEDIKKDLGL